MLGTHGPWLALVTGGRRGFAEFIPFAEKLAAKGLRVVLHDRRNSVPCLLSLAVRPRVRGLLLMRITGGDFAASRLPENHHGQFIRAARKGGMQAVCATEQYRERIQANPDNLPRLMAMDPARSIAVMSHWLDIFLKGPRKPVLGMTEEAMRAIRVPTLVVPGNDKTHDAAGGRAAALIPGSVLVELPISTKAERVGQYVHAPQSPVRRLLRTGPADSQV